MLIGVNTETKYDVHDLIDAIFSDFIIYNVAFIADHSLIWLTVPKCAFLVFNQPGQPFTILHYFKTTKCECASKIDLIKYIINFI